MNCGRATANLLNLAQQHETKARFLVTGGLNTLFGLAIYPLLMFFTASFFHYLVVLAIAQALSILFSYLTNKCMVFCTKGNYLAEFVKFVTFHLVYFAANIVTLPIMVELFGVRPVCGQFGFALAVIITSYFWHSKITFHRKRPEE